MNVEGRLETEVALITMSEGVRDGTSEVGNKSSPVFLGHAWSGLLVNIVLVMLSTCLYIYKSKEMFMLM